MRRRSSLGVALAAVALAAGAVPAHAAVAEQGQQDIVDTAVGAGQFTTLARALQAAGLVEALKAPGPFTVFAPTDAAFAKVPAATLNALLADPNRLRAVLTYHVVPGRVTAADVVRLQSATSLQGEPIRIATAGSTVRLNSSATVVQADVLASNGVIHVIDTVLMPPSMLTLPQTGGGTPSVVLPGAIAAAAAGAALLGAVINRSNAGLELQRASADE